MAKYIKNYLEIENEINQLFEIYSKENYKNNFIREKIFLLFYEYVILNIIYKIKYYPRILERKDLVNEGTLVIDSVLINYIHKEYKCDFVTFAKGKIKQEIDKLIRLSHSPSIPIRIYNDNKKNRKLNKNVEILSSQYIEKEIITKNYYNPYFPKILDPHQIYIKKLNHEILLNKMKKILNSFEYQVLVYSYGIPKESDDYQYVLDDTEISSKLNITKKQIYKYREKAISKIKFNK